MQRIKNKGVNHLLVPVHGQVLIEELLGSSSKENKPHLCWVESQMHYIRPGLNDVQAGAEFTYVLVSVHQAPVNDTLSDILEITTK